MTAAARNLYKGEAGLSDETLLARSFAKMEAAVEEAVSVADAPWVKAQRLATELSQVLAEIGESNFAYIQPGNAPSAVFFGLLSQDEGGLEDLEAAPLEAKSKSITALYRQWEREISIASTDRAVEEAFLLGKLIVPKPATTLQEFAMKVLVDTGYGDHLLDDSIVREARDIVASPPASNFAPPETGASLPDLIERHRLALLSDKAAWNSVADLVDAIENIQGRRKYEDDAGYKAAIGLAGQTSDAVKALETEIAAVVPTSLQEAADKARWIVWAYHDDYCYIDDHELGNALLVEALRAIGRAVA